MLIFMPILTSRSARTIHDKDRSDNMDVMESGSCENSPDMAES